jgi:polynucleotide 5'-hydroxyl-kinase GRC3/NOL9
LAPDRLHVPAAWKSLNLNDLGGLLLVMGGPDAGKSTFINYLLQRMIDSSRAVAVLEGDPGQTLSGPPGALTLRLYPSSSPSRQDPQVSTQERAVQANQPRQAGLARPDVRQAFVGSTSPVGHMLPMLVAAERLARFARRQGFTDILYDSCGFIDPARGGLAFKLAEIDLLRPGRVLAIQRAGELESLLTPLRLSGRVEISHMQPSPAAKSRSQKIRQAHRAAMYARHFAKARKLQIDWSELAVFPRPDFYPLRLLAFEDREGFSLGLGILLDSNPSTRQLTVFTNIPNLDGVTTLNLANLEVDPHTFQDRRTPLS